MFLEIENIEACQILDSRGNPTVEAEIELSDETKACASVPSGASTGTFEAVELRDKIPNEYLGQGVQKAVNNINEIIAPNLIGEDAANQRNIDNLMLELDGSFNKSTLGANAILAISLACSRVSAKAYEIPLYRYIGGINACTLPTPMMNILNGGVHANNKLDFQEFMIAPVGLSNFSEALQAGTEIFHALKMILNEKGLSTNVGDEGGYAPNISTPEEAIELIIKAIEQAGYNTKIIKICLDVAASELYERGECSGGICSLAKYCLKGINKEFNHEQMIDYLEKLVQDYPIISIEDGLAEDDDLGWISLTEKLGHECQLVGDDLFVTNVERLVGGLRKKMANSILIKPNQVGTLSETLDTIFMAQKNNYSTIISHRSGETEDTFIADLAVGVNAGIIKTGSLARTDRICKYNRLLKIEEELGQNAKYMGIRAFKGFEYDINDIPPCCNIN